MAYYSTPQPARPVIPQGGERNLLLAQALMQGGGPVASPMQGFGRIAEALSSRYLAKRGEKQDEDRRRAIAERLSGIDFGSPDAASMLIGLGAETGDDSLRNAGIGLATREPKERDRKTAKDRSGRLRYLDSGDPVFADEGEMPPEERYGKPPAGYRYKEDGTLEAIEGGPATKLTADVAGRVALAESVKNEIPAAFKEFDELSLRDYAEAQAGFGRIGRAQRTVRGGIEAALRLMTGAAAPESEVARYEQMFMPATTDTPETRAQKQMLLTNFLDKALEVANQGRQTGAAQPAQADPLATPGQPGEIRVGPDGRRYRYEP